MGEARADADTTLLQHQVSVIVAVLQTLQDESDHKSKFDRKKLSKDNGQKTYSG